jgi:tetratricopeptide (TPR) repeat protein
MALFNVRENSFRIARVGELLRLKAKYQGLWMRPVDLCSWGLKQYGRLYVLECLNELKPGRVLEIGPGMYDDYFIEICRERGIEYWACDDTSTWWNLEQLKDALSGQPDVRFVPGLVGQFLEALPDRHFDLIFSISVAEHVPWKGLDDFYRDIKRMLAPGGRTVHTIDLIGSDMAKNHYEAIERAGCRGPQLDARLDIPDDALYEPLEHVHLCYFQQRHEAIWGAANVDYYTRHYATVLFNTSLSEDDDRFVPPAPLLTPGRELEDIERILFQEKRGLLSPEDFAEMETAVRWVLRHAQLPPAPTYRILVELFRRQGRSAEARDILLSALAQYPDETGLLNASLGAACAHMGLYGEAREAYRAALDKNPRHLGWRYSLGAMELAAGDRPAAREQLRTLLDMEAETGEKFKNRDLLKSLALASCEFAPFL